MKRIVVGVFVGALCGCSGGYEKVSDLPRNTEEYLESFVMYSGMKGAEYITDLGDEEYDQDKVKVRLAAWYASMPGTEEDGTSFADEVAAYREAATGELFGDPTTVGPDSVIDMPPVKTYLELIAEQHSVKLSQVAAFALYLKAASESEPNSDVRTRLVELARDAGVPEEYHKQLLTASSKEVPVSEFLLGVDSDALWSEYSKDMMSIIEWYEDRWHKAEGLIEKQEDE